MMKKLFILLFICFFITACSSIEEAGKVLRNEKSKTTDEFLVKKREPLVFPPDYDKVPEPGSIQNNNKPSDEKEKIKKILKVPSESKSVTNKPTSIEEKILREIRK